jgi:phosphate starvation-inducible PhoH-like protein
MLKSFAPAKPCSINQERYIHAIRKNTITFCTGLAGTGKTFLALSEALRFMHRESKVYSNGIVLIRPYVPSNTGEKVGALPGDLQEKVGPYVQSIRDNLRKLIPRNEVESIIRNHIEFTILSMCRGRSFNDCIVIVEEAQNVPLDGGAMKMVLSRVGRNCKMIIAGDMDQCDIRESRSGLADAIKRLHGVTRLGIVKLDDYEDIQRSPIVSSILRRYDDKNDH